MNPTTPPLISVSAIDLPVKQKTSQTFPASLSAGIVGEVEKEEGALISLNNNCACVDLIPLASAMVFLSLTVRGIKEHSAFPF